MPDYDLWAKAALVSFLASGAIWLLIASPSRTPHSVRSSLGWILGPGLGFYAGCVLLDMGPRWPARVDRDRLLVILLPLTLLVEVVAAWPAAPRGLKGLLRLVLAGTAAPILLHHSVYLADLSGPHSAEWPPAQRLLILTGLAALLAGEWSLLARLQARTGDRVPSLALALSSLAAGLTVMLSGSVSSGLPALPLAGALAGATVASFFASTPSHANRCLGFGLIGSFGILVSGRFFAALPTSTALCVLLAPLMAWLPECPGIRSLRPGIRACLAVALVVTPLVIAVANAKTKFDEMTEARWVSGVRLEIHGK